MSKTAPTRPRWLFVIPRFPRPDHSGGERRLIEVMNAFAKRCDVSVLAMAAATNDDSEYQRAMTTAGFRLVGSGFRAGLLALLLHRFDAIFFEFYFTTDGLLRAARALQPQAMAVVDSVDIHFLREREQGRLANLDPALAAQTERQELEAYRAADVTVVVSEQERRVLLQHGIERTELIPIIVPTLERAQRERDAELLFVGGFNHAPNGLAVDWFHEEVWPIVRQQVPEARWVIAGSNTPDRVLALDGQQGISVAGFVPDTAPLLHSAQVSIAPLTFGGGMKGKVSEALAAGVPVVTTKWGAQGLEEGIGTAFIVADSAAEFASAVVTLLTDRGQRERLSTGGQSLAEHLCSIASAMPAISALIDQSTTVRRAPALPRRLFSFLNLMATYSLRIFGRIFKTQPA